MEVLNEGAQGLVAAVLREVTAQKVGNGWLHGDHRHSGDAVQLILPLPGLHLQVELVDGTQAAMEGCERIVAAFVIGTPETLPRVVVLHLDLRPTGETNSVVAGLDEASIGAGGEEGFRTEIHFDGDKGRFLKARRVFLVVIEKVRII